MSELNNIWKRISLPVVDTTAMVSYLTLLRAVPLGSDPELPHQLGNPLLRTGYSQSEPFYPMRWWYTSFKFALFSFKNPPRRMDYNLFLSKYRFHGEYVGAIDRL
jgi:hypothetical protein